VLTQALSSESPLSTRAYVKGLDTSTMKGLSGIFQQSLAKRLDADVPDGDGFIDASNIDTVVQPEPFDSGFEYELLGYQLLGGSVVGADILATNVSQIIKVRGTCDGDVFNAGELVDTGNATFLSATPLRPGQHTFLTSRY